MKLETLLLEPCIGESALARYWRVSEDLLYADSKPAVRTVQTISDNIRLVHELSENQPVKLIITIAKSPVPDKETRDFVAKQLPQVYSAMAMIAPNKLTGFIINLIYGLKKTPIPMKTFSNFEDAEKWILSIN